MKFFQYFIIVLFLLASAGASAQDPLRSAMSRFGGGGGGGGSDSLIHRTGMEDSLTISFRYLDTTRYVKFDSTLNDFTVKFPIPADYWYLGNNGNAAKSLLFSPFMKPGWDPGFHAYDIYKFTFDNTRFFTTTRPYSELGYLLGSKSEQMISFLHTQNITPNWNAAFQFNLNNSPGTFKNQNTNHSNLRLNTSYQSKNKRYRLFFIGITSKIQSSENGGIQNDQDYMNDLEKYKERNIIPVQLGNYVQPSTTVFNSKITTGTKHKTGSFLLRQQYDLGKKDSLVTDSSVIPLFYPRVRAEYTIQYDAYGYSFVDQQPDTSFYTKNYGFLTTPDPNFLVEEKWKVLQNDFSIYTFPDAKNPAQFLKLGASLQNITGVFTGGERKYYNIILHGEYRNKTRNKKWDMEAYGQLYATGENAGDYTAYASLQRSLARNGTFLRIGAQNTNRSPSYIYSGNSSFNVGLPPSSSFNKENILKIFGMLNLQQYKLKLSGAYFLATNYTYFKDYYTPAQQSQLFNVIQVNAEKDIFITRHLIWHAQLAFQQAIGDAPVNLPLMYTRNRIGYEGSLGFKKLRLATGFEVKYNTPYKADGYSPLLGQFYQSNQTVSLKMPEIDAYAHFRITSFTAYVRLENLNTLSIKNGFTFSNNNFSAVDYPYPGMLFRLGIYWSFVN